MRSPDQKMESAYDLWAMAKIAKSSVKRRIPNNTGNVRCLFLKNMEKMEFMNVTPAFEVMKNNGLYQGTRWQYRWAGSTIH